MCYGTNETRRFSCHTSDSSAGIFCFAESLLLFTYLRNSRQNGAMCIFAPQILLKPDPLIPRASRTDANCCRCTWRWAAAPGLGSEEGQGQGRWGNSWRRLAAGRSSTRPAEQHRGSPHLHKLLHWRPYCRRYLLEWEGKSHPSTWIEHAHCACGGAWAMNFWR